MIAGIGIDVVEIGRIEKLLRENRQRFIVRIAHRVETRGAPRLPKEKKRPGRLASMTTATRNGRILMRRAEYWAARFAAKEAFAKALGTGIGKTVPWNGIGVKRGSLGNPTIVCSSAVARELKKRGICRIHLALTHSRDTAIAVVILEQGLIKS